MKNNRIKKMATYSNGLLLSKNTHYTSMGFIGSCGSFSRKCLIVSTFKPSNHWQALIVNEL